MDNSEFPSSAYLQSLREEGIIPRSKVLTRALTAFFIIAAILLILQSGNLLTAFKQMIAASELKTVATLKKEIFTVLLLPLAAGVLGALLVGFFQTRFRLQPLFFRRNLKQDFYAGGAFFRVLQCFLKIAGGLLAAFFAILVAGRYWLLPLAGSQELISNSLKIATMRLGFLVLGLLAVVILGSFLLSRIMFLYEHRVSADFNEERDDPRVGRVY